MDITKTAGTKNVFIRYTALAPIIQAEPSGRKTNRVYGRRIATACESGDGEIKYDLCVSGAGVRCPARDLFCRLVFKKLGLADQKGVISKEVPYELAETILKGGRSSVGDTIVKIDAKNYVEIYDVLPFFGLFGSFRFPGRLAVGFALPLTKKRKEIEKLLGNPFAEDEPVPDLSEVKAVAHFTRMRLDAVEEEPKAKAVENFLGYLEEKGQELLREAVKEAFVDKIEEGLNTKRIMDIIRADRDALAAVEEFFGLCNNAAKNNTGNPEDRYYKAIKEKLEGLMIRLQMLYSVENYIPLGTVLLTRAVLLPGFGDDDLMEKTFHAYLEVLLARPVLGGMAARGFGFVHAEAKVKEGGMVKNFNDVSKGNGFWEWLERNKVAIKHNLLSWFWPLIQGDKKKIQKRALYS